MSTLYKLTNSAGMTKNDTHWYPGVTHTVDIPGNTLCSNQVIHAYENILLAELMNPIHGNFSKDKKCFKCEGIIVINDGLKVGVKSLYCIEEVTIPTITTINRITFGIFSALEVYKEASFVYWAENWLSGRDRSKETIHIDYNTTSAAYYATSAAYYAATSAIYATAAAYAAEAVEAAETVEAAARINKKINFILLAEKAMKVT